MSAFLSEKICFSSSCAPPFASAPRPVSERGSTSVKNGSVAVINGSTACSEGGGTCCFSRWPFASLVAPYAISVPANAPYAVSVPHDA
eukprot:1419206-Rhodomonas_salina.1